MGEYQIKYFRSVPLILIIAIILLLTWSPRIHAEEREETNVCFRWAFGAMVGSGNDRMLVSITRDRTLKTGDQLKMLVELQNKCFVYLIYQTGKDEVEMLFPYDLMQFTTDYKTLKKYYIPQGDLWFKLDENVGLETFHLLASAKRLIKLETLIESHRLAEADTKPQIGKQILDEIRRVKLKNRNFEGVAERPAAIGGSVRGIPKDKAESPFDIDPIADRVSASNFYSRTFTIDHQ